MTRLVLLLSLLLLAGTVRAAPIPYIQDLERTVEKYKGASKVPEASIDYLAKLHKWYTREVRADLKALPLVDSLDGLASRLAAGRTPYTTHWMTAQGPLVEDIRQVHEGRAVSLESKPLDAARRRRLAIRQELERTIEAQEPDCRVLTKLATAGGVVGPYHRDVVAVAVGAMARKGCVATIPAILKRLHQRVLDTPVGTSLGSDLAGQPRKVHGELVESYLRQRFCRSIPHLSPTGVRCQCHHQYRPNWSVLVPLVRWLGAPRALRLVEGCRARGGQPGMGGHQDDWPELLRRLGAPRVALTARRQKGLPVYELRRQPRRGPLRVEAELVTMEPGRLLALRPVDPARYEEFESGPWVGVAHRDRRDRAAKAFGKRPSPDEAEQRELAAWLGGRAATEEELAWGRKRAGVASEPGLYLVVDVLP
jgi:hypothetical protein